MTSDRKSDPRSRFNKILSGGEQQEQTGETSTASPLSRLPKPRPRSGSAGPLSSLPPAGTPREAPPPARPGPGVTPAPVWGRFGPAFWTATGILSLVVNVVLLVALVVALRALGGAQFAAGEQAAGLLGGLYTNFEKLDRASIVTSIPVDAQIPLSMAVPVQRTTDITLADDVTISGARVRINTAALNIDAPAEVTLPRGTRLTVALDFVLNVADTVPVHLDVPVDIPMSQTQLHEPFVGLQDVVQPFYCLVEPTALTLDGLPVCR